MQHIAAPLSGASITPPPPKSGTRRSRLCLIQKPVFEVIHPLQRAWGHEGNSGACRALHKSFGPGRMRLQTWCRRSMKLLGASGKFAAPSDGSSVRAEASITEPKQFPKASAMLSSTR